MKRFLPYRKQLSGFTLIEILMVVAVMGILAAAVSISVSGSSAKSRDAERQADLRSLQNAIELYKNRYGRYPYQATSTTGGGWSGEIGTIYAPNDLSGQYIVGLAPEFIPVLPTDPKRNGNDSGYIYRTNAAGTVYKLKAHKTVESEVVTYLHPMKACDIRVGPNVAGNVNSASHNRETVGWCGRVYRGGATVLPPECNALQLSFNASYGVWGGFLPKGTVSSDVCVGVWPNSCTINVQSTTDVICM